MNNSRYNSFNKIHKGLRAMLYETAQRLQQTNLSIREHGEKVIKQLEDVLYLFESHAHNEDHFYNEPLEKINPEIARIFEKEHEEDHRLAKVIHDLIEQWNNQTTDEDREKIGRNLFYTFNEFTAFNLYHMNKEELELNAALWKVYSDAEIKATEQSIVQQTPPQKMMMYAKWMIRGVNDNELIHWLGEVKAFAPTEVYAMVLSLAEKELPEERFRAVKNILDRHHEPALI
jgi:hypothetical protein